MSGFFQVLARQVILLSRKVLGSGYWNVQTSLIYAFMIYAVL